MPKDTTKGNTHWLALFQFFQPVKKEFPHFPQSVKKGFCQFCQSVKKDYLILVVSLSNSFL